MPLPIHIRPETPADVDAVRAVHEQAFERPDEADLVDRLRRTVDPLVSLVAVSDGPVVGHILFSPVRVVPSEAPPPSAVSKTAASKTAVKTPVSETPTLMALAPMAVHPDRQRRGVGTRLVRAGRDACAARGVDALVVLGHPDYYPRFGFRPARGFGLTCPYDVPDDAFLALELTPDALRDVAGRIRYPDAFASL